VLHACPLAVRSWALWILFTENLLQYGAVR
jgi:hypothetical protein